MNSEYPSEVVKAYLFIYDKPFLNEGQKNELANIFKDKLNNFPNIQDHYNSYLKQEINFPEFKYRLSQFLATRTFKI